MDVLATRPFTVINDAYNASPDSMRAALHTLVQIAAPGQRTIAVLGNMGDLGDASDEEHDRVGLEAVRLDVSRLLVVGRDARATYLGAVHQGSWGGEAEFAEDADAAYARLVEIVEPGDLVLVKSSRDAGLRFLGDRLGEYAKGRAR